jgi:hypothetical protein
MNKTVIVLALILIIAGQLIILSSFHEANAKGHSETNAIITIAKLNYVDARINLSILPLGSNDISSVKIIFPNGTAVNLTATNGGKPPEIYTETFSLSRTGDAIGITGADSSSGYNSISLTSKQPLTITSHFNVNDTQNYVLHSNENFDVYTFIIYGWAEISISGYGMGL